MKLQNPRRPERRPEHRRESRRSQSTPETPLARATSTGDMLLRLGGLYFFSGIPALIYQIVWQRLLVLHSGVGTTSVSIIVAAYLLGIGVGSFGGAWLSRRLSPAQALTAFAMFELSVAVCGFASPRMLYDVLYQQFGWAYANVFVAGLLHFAALIVPTTLMGATLPLMTRALVQDSQLAPKSISLLYGLNTLGAAAGAALAPWVLLPWVGVQGACSVAAALNFSVALVALRLRGRLTASSLTTGSLAKGSQSLSGATERATPVPVEAQQQAPFAWWVTLYFCSGFAAIGLEIVWFRILDVAVKSTAYTFGTLLATYLACMAVGSIVGARRIDQLQRPLSHFLWLQWLITATSATAVLILLYTPGNWWGMSWLVSYWSQPEPIFPAWENLLAGAGLYILLPLFLMGYATTCMGYSFCVLQRGVQHDAQLCGYKVGVLQAVNIAGCIAGSLLVGLWLLNVLGTAHTLRVLVLVGGGFAVLGGCVVGWSGRFVGCLAGTAVLALLLPNNQGFWLRLHGHDRGSSAIVAEDVTGVACIAPDPSPSKWRVSVNGKAQSNVPFGGFHSKLGAIPSTLHPLPESIAIIGLGSGNTAWSAACRSETTEITVFEICTAEALLLPHYPQLGQWTDVNTFLQDSRVKIDGRDARFVLMTEDRQYDLIEADAIRSNGAFAGYLYSLEFFKLCGSRLKPGGFMCTWAPTPGTVLTFTQAFPHVLQLDGGLLLIGSNEPIALDREAWGAKFDNSPISAYLGEAVVRECLTSIQQAVMYIPGGERGMPNTDLFPFDEFRN